MDLEAALARVEGDTGLLAEMAALFLRDCDSALAAIRSALLQKDSRTAARGAHALKGSLASLSAEEARYAAGQLEALAVCGEYSKASEARDHLADAVARLRPLLEDLCRSFPN